MHYFPFLVCIIVGIIIGLFFTGILDKNNDDQELSKYVPSIEEILCVLHVIRATYRCSAHETKCVDEAIRLIESMEEETDDGE